MHKIQNNIIKKDLVLLGAGHSNIEVIKYFGKLKLKGLRITLISKNTFATYSGMVPGFIEGKYKWNEINIDLIKLCNKNNIKIVIAEIFKILGKENKVFFKDRPPIEYDILSINLGIKSSTSNIIGSENYSLPLKPISQIHKTLNLILNNKSKNIVIIGAGAAGVEVSLALNKRLKVNKVRKKIILISKNNSLMTNYSNSVSKILEKELLKNNIEIIFNSKVTKIKKDYVEINNTKKIYTNCSVLATNASALDIFKRSDLKLSKNGFINVSSLLQSKSHNNIFASGDNSDIEDYNLTKAGVYSVKQAKTLKINLKRFFLKKNLLNYSPQKNYLSLVGITNNKAIANKSIITLKGSFFWTLKKYIDKKFIKKYSYTASIKENISFQTKSIEPIYHSMQCEGCGSKVPQYVLDTVFQKNLKLGSYDADVISGTKTLVHTVDVVTSLIDDLYLMGRIAAKHCLNDLFAANSIPISIQMILGIPRSLSTIQKRDIYQIKEGALSIFKELNIPISGGHTHSIENNKNTIGFSLVGKLNNKLVKKNYNSQKQKIYMTGKIGTAVVMAALKQNIIDGKYYNEAISEMTNSNYDLYKLFKKNNILNLTDISGFGLAIHLNNLLIRNKSFKGANIYLDKIPMLNGAKKAINKNIKSSLNNSNKSSLKNILDIKAKNKSFLNILFDPQTAGGFLFITSNKTITQDLKNQNIIFSEIGEITSNHNKIRVL